MTSTPHTRLRTRVAGTVVAAGVVVAGGLAVAPTAQAAPAPAAVVVQQAPAQAQKAAQLRTVKAQARRAATRKIAAYRAIRTDRARLAALPDPLVANVRSSALRQERRLATLRTRAGQARTLGQARSVRAQVAAVRPAELGVTVRRLSTAFASVDPGILRDVLDTLLGEPTAGTPLEPLVDVLNQLLNEVLAGSPDTEVVEQVLTALHGLIGSLELSPDTDVVEQVLTVVHDLLVLLGGR